ncbi:hypothetical protein GCM10027610_095480 [Dactylosporangium cerinum]
MVRIASRTRCRVSGAIRTSSPVRLLSTSDTVAWLTPVIRAMSRCVTRLLTGEGVSPFEACMGQAFHELALRDHEHDQDR